MRLQCLLVTQERELLELVRPVLENSGMEVEVRAETRSALEICGRRHLDGFLVDCDTYPVGGTCWPTFGAATPTACPPSSR